MTQEQLDKEKERDENISKMLSYMELLQKQVLENVGELKEVKRVLRIEEASQSSYFNAGGNQVEYTTTVRADGDKDLTVVTRSGKVVVGNAKDNDGVEAHEEEKIVMRKRITFKYWTEIRSRIHWKFISKVPSKSCKKIKKRLVEALLEMSGYPKLMKELVTKERSMDFETIKVSHNCSAIMTSEMIIKKDDPGAFTIPCTVGMLQFAKALCDLGASINLMPYAIYKQLGLGEPKSTTMWLLMADQSIKHPIGILYDILVKVDRFIFPADFVILDCGIDAGIPIILGRPFVATGRELVDVENGELKFRVNTYEVTFNVCKSMKYPTDIHLVSTINVID
ncbi:uncharacterized protein LOC125830605 [Solanum verrucosum]|uniref:uncharacterized protein LOC125830605 n=1 Tax=Solanum verrucosum TaxID=315347 RepID=UPI0020D13C15|nr:uncharacterized protein LOC125830605 [Solanum verrucosum]